MEMLDYVYYFIKEPISIEMLLHNIYMLMFFYFMIKLLLELLRALIGYNRREY